MPFAFGRASSGAGGVARTDAPRGICGIPDFKIVFHLLETPPLSLKSQTQGCRRQPKIFTDV
jgi:hypothetical protein